MIRHQKGSMDTREDIRQRCLINKRGLKLSQRQIKICKTVLSWGREYALISTGKGKLWISSKSIKIRFDHGKIPEDLGYRQEERNQD